MADTREPRGEEEIIQRYFAPLAAGFPGAFGLKDDCAALSVPPGHDLVVTTDPIIADVHFPAGVTPFAIGWKALAVNISDLTAKGARPFAYVMALALPVTPKSNWLVGFTKGLDAAQKKFGCRLAGGDLDRTPGPLTISITAFGLVPAGAMVRRSTVMPGDWVYTTGTIGDAYLGLRLWRDPPLAEAWRLDDARRTALGCQYLVPNKSTPVVAGWPDILRDHASAAIDVSDGLVKDFDRLCQASRVGGRLDAARVPLSDAARAVLDVGGATLSDLITGGEDYQTLLTVHPPRATAFEGATAARGIPVARIGEITEDRRVVVFDADGRALHLPSTGWDHF